MKTALLATFCLLFVVSGAFAQAGNISLYSDQAGINCLITDAGAGLLPVFAVHTLTLGATAIQFAAPAPACMIAAIWLSDTPVYGVTLGNSQVGVAIGYGVCVGSPNHVLTINMFAQGLSQACCEWHVVPDPNVPSGNVEVVDCGNNLLFGNGGTAWVNSDGTCGCEPATEAATWGALKATYAQ